MNTLSENWLRLLKLTLRKIKYLYVERLFSYVPLRATQNVRGKALLVFVPSAFRVNLDSFPHSYFLEARVLARTLSDLGYAVDVVHHDLNPKLIDFSNYSIILGFGRVFEASFFEASRDVLRIYYANGASCFFQNKQTIACLKRYLGRLKLFHLLSANSIRYRTNTSDLSENLSHAVLSLGGPYNHNLYLNKDGPDVYSIPAPLTFHASQASQSGYSTLPVIHNSKVSSEINFIWIGGMGYLHKGLDICLQAFSNLPHMHLHVLGHTRSEDATLDDFKNRFCLSSIHFHGFVDVNTFSFSSIVSSSSFVISPSCSEGGNVAALNAIAVNGCIPICSPQSTIEVPHKITITDLNYQSLEASLRVATSLPYEYLLRAQVENKTHINTVHCIQNYEKCLNSALTSILQ